MPVLIYLVLPESPRWHLRKGQPQVAVDIVNRIIRRSGNRVPPLTAEALGAGELAKREELPPYWVLFAAVVMVTGALITGFTVLSAFTACRAYLSEQFPTALRGRGQPFGESIGRLFAGTLAPFLMEPHTASATIFFGTLFVIVAIGAFIPLAFGRETVGQLETVTEGVTTLA